MSGRFCFQQKRSSAIVRDLRRYKRHFRFAMERFLAEAIDWYLLVFAKK